MVWCLHDRIGLTNRHVAIGLCNGNMPLHSYYYLISRIYLFVFEDVKSP